MQKTTLRIAVVSDDLQTISAHFERAQNYLVFTTENSQIIRQEIRARTADAQFASQGQEPLPVENSQDNLGMIIDCDVLLAGTMEHGTYEALRLRSIEPILTDRQDAQKAVTAYLTGELINQLERLR